MTLEIFKSKLHPLKVTEADLYYEGSISIDEELLEAANLLPHEKVQVVNINNGERLETYTIAAPRGSRVVCMNGPAARVTAVGDRIIVISYAQMTPDEAKIHKPRIVILNDKNDPVSVLDESEYGRKTEV
ncbi:MAG: aspartate 1-decarboxylase [Balneolales bacterium]